MRLELSEDQNHVTFECPGCGYPHRIRIKGPPPVWGFNGNMEKPTFTPSINVTASNEEEGLYFRCHSYVEDGMIRFLSDCTHAFKDQTLQLKDIE